MTPPDRFRLRVDHRVEGTLLVVFVTMLVLFGMLFAKPDVPRWLLGFVSLPLVIGAGACLRALFARPAVLLLDEEGVELQEGTSRIGPRPWRIEWSELLEPVTSHGLFGEQLLLRTRETTLSVPLRSKALGWNLERKEELFAKLAAKGFPPVRETVAEGEGVESFLLDGGKGLLSTRTVLAWTLVTLGVMVVLEIVSHRWERVITDALLIFILSMPFLAGARSLSQLDVSDEAVTLRLLTPAGFLAVYRFHPELKASTLWTVRWDEIRRVRLGRQEGHGRDLWMEIETNRAKHRLKYRDAEGDIENAEGLRRLFNAHGFPIELVIWPENFGAGQTS